MLKTISINLLQSSLTATMTFGIFTSSAQAQEAVEDLAIQVQAYVSFSQSGDSKSGLEISSARQMCVSGHTWPIYVYDGPCGLADLLRRHTNFKRPHKWAGDVDLSMYGKLRLRLRIFQT